MNNSIGSYLLEYENGFSYYTFVPEHLANLRLDSFDEETYSLLINAHRQLGIFEGRIRTISHLDQYASLLSHYEAVLSCKMAGIDISMVDLWDTYSKNNIGITAVESCLSAMKYGFEHIHKTGNPSKQFGQIYHVLTGCQETSDMALLRKIQIFTEPRVSVKGLPLYNPPNPENVKEAYLDFEKYWNMICPYDVLVQAALVYYQFCTIQPFSDDNDRITRILTNLFVVKREILSQPLLCLSYYLCKDKVGYNDQLNYLRGRYNNSYRSWIKYFIKAIIIAAEKTNEILVSLERIRYEDILRLSMQEKLPKHAMALYEGLWNNPIIEARHVVKSFSISYNTAAKIVSSLANIGILEQIGEQGRYRRYVYKKVLETFAEK